MYSESRPRPRCDLQTEFDCGNGQPCLPRDRVCDTINDCGNYEDEPRDGCGQDGKCGVENGGCDQLCTDTPQGHFCSCFHGFKLVNNTCTGKQYIPGVDTFKTLNIRILIKFKWI